MAKVIRIDITSDTICPWCYIGYKQLEIAMDSFRKEQAQEGGSVSFDLKWHAFLLNPDAQKAVPKRDLYARKFGSDRVDKLFEYMRGKGAPLGIQFSYEGLIGPTRDSHRLMALAGTVGKQTECAKALFNAYFERDQDISSREQLEEIALSVGIQKEKAREMLESTQFNDVVDEDVKQALRSGIDGVPYFVIDGETTLHGAQSPSSFLQYFRRS